MGIFSKIYRLINPKEFGEFSNKHISEIDFNQIHDIFGFYYRYFLLR